MDFKKILPWSDGEKALNRMTFQGGSSSLSNWMFMPRSNRNYAREVGDGLSNSIVYALVHWIGMNFPEAPLALKKRTPPDIAFEKLPDHDLLDLIEYPNDYYTSFHLWSATSIDWNIHGNAYWLKIRGRGGKPVQLWYVPQQFIKPIGTKEKFISHYEYRPNSTELINIDPADMVHFRNGIDPNNPIQGLSNLKCLLREIYTDDEAANFSASLLTNLGVPGVVIAPQSIAGAFTTLEDDSENIKRQFANKFGGDNKGEPLVFTAPTDIKVLSFSPDQMNLVDMRRVPEERAAAVMMLHPGVVGFGAGLAHSSFSNYKDARAASYENNIIPTQRMFSATIKAQLLIDFEKSKRDFKVEFDLSEVRALSEDQVKLGNRIKIAVGAGIITVAEARTALGYSVDKTHDVYLRSPMMVIVPVKDGADPDFIPEHSAAAKPPGTTNTSVPASTVDTHVPEPVHTPEKDPPPKEATPKA